MSIEVGDKIVFKTTAPRYNESKGVVFETFDPQIENKNIIGIKFKSNGQVYGYNKNKFWTVQEYAKRMIVGDASMKVVYISDAFPELLTQGNVYDVIWRNDTWCRVIMDTGEVQEFLSGRFKEITELAKEICNEKTS